MMINCLNAFRLHGFWVDFHFFLIIMFPRRESKSDGSESLKSFQRASIFSTSSLDCNNTDFCWIRGLFESKKSLFCWCVKVSRAEVIAHGSCRRFLWKLPHITRVPLDSASQGCHRHILCLTSQGSSCTLKLPHITRVPPTSKGCQITSQECHPHHKGATRQQKSGTSHHKGATVIHFETASHHATHFKRVPDIWITWQECHRHTLYLVRFSWWWRKC